MAQLLQAEATRARGHSANALRQYQEATQQARRAGYLHHAALCSERRAGLLEEKRRGTEAEATIGLAAELYEQWGARAKALGLKRSMRSN
jgi:hypothetical protein